MAERRKKGQGSVRVLPNGKAAYRFTDPSGKKVEIRCATEEEAYNQLNRVLYEISTGEYIAPSDTTLSAWVEKWLKLYKSGKLKESSYFNYFKMWQLYIKPSKIGGMELDQIRQDHVQEFVNQMAKKHAKATVRYAYTVLSASLDKAANPSIGLIRRNPAKGIEWPKFKKPVERKMVLTAEEQKRLEAVLPGRYLSDIITLMLCTGMRPGEALGLQWKDVDLNHRKLKIKGNRMLIGQIDDDMNVTGYQVKDQDSTKSHSGDRVIPMNDTVYELMKRMKSTRQHTKYVCVGHDKQPPSIHILAGALSRSLKKAGVDDVSPHKLRHTFATRCIEAGMNPKALQKIMGHATLAQTMDLYVNPTDDYLVDEMAKLDPPKPTNEPKEATI